jgi:hypothetical protein
LVDDCGFIIDELSTVISFVKHNKIGKFVNKVFDMRVKAQTKGENALIKNVLNSSYGSDGQNNEKFANIRFVSKKKELTATANYNFISSVKINDDLYLVEKDALSASCKKPLHTAYATLSNAKYWFVSFVYKFMYKCLDPERFHFIVCDTDSYMWAVSGDPTRGHEQHFEAIIKDKDFYDKNYELFFPKKKTLMTLEYEHCCLHLLALAPKNY